MQNLLGTMGKVRTQQGEDSDAVRLDLQVDCYAGMWSKHATTADDATGEAFILDLTQNDIDRALDAAAAVGDDQIQRRTGRVNPDSWTPRLRGPAPTLVQRRDGEGHPGSLRHLRCGRP